MLLTSLPRTLTESLHQHSQSSDFVDCVHLTRGDFTSASRRKALVRSTSGVLDVWSSDGVKAIVQQYSL